MLKLTNLVGFGGGGVIDLSDWPNYDGTLDGTKITTTVAQPDVLPIVVPHHRSMGHYAGRYL